MIMSVLPVEISEFQFYEFPETPSEWVSKSCYFAFVAHLRGFVSAKKINSPWQPQWSKERA